MTEGICLLLIDDGREDYLERCRWSLASKLPRFDAEVTIIDADHRLGFTGAVQEGWRQARETGCDWIWHQESDFLMNGPVPLDRIQAVMERWPDLVQMSLKRQPVNDQEIAAGDILLVRPTEYVEVSEGEDRWLEHRVFFTCNPSLYRMSLTDRGWPDEEHSEGKFGGRLFRDLPAARSGIWGAFGDGPRVHHIGTHRKGHGY